MDQGVAWNATKNEGCDVCVREKAEHVGGWAFLFSPWAFLLGWTKGTWDLKKRSGQKKECREKFCSFTDVCFLTLNPHSR